MARRTFFLLSFLLLSLAALFAGGVVAAAQTASGPNRTSDSIAHVTLGQSAVPLYGPWKFTVGDSPIDPKTGKPLWAEPDFDDSKWETVDLTPKDGDFDPNSGLSGYVPGWTAKGHPGYWGYAWYRIRVAVQARPGAALWRLSLPSISEPLQLPGAHLMEWGGAPPASDEPAVVDRPPVGVRNPDQLLRPHRAFHCHADPHPAIRIDTHRRRLPAVSLRQCL